MRIAAGLLMFKRTDGYLKVFIVHPGGPYWEKRDKGAWSIPKGEPSKGETDDNFYTALREFFEETGFAPCAPYIYLGQVTQKSGKIVEAWAFEKDRNVDYMCSNTLEIEYPLHSGKMIRIPEVDRGDYFTVEEAAIKLNPAQAEFLPRLQQMLDYIDSGGTPSGT